MSTKVTILYGDPQRDGPENDYHLYYDYADMKVHLEIGHKEIYLPPKLRLELELLWDLWENIRGRQAILQLLDLSLHEGYHTAEKTKEELEKD